MSKKKSAQRRELERDAGIVRTPPKGGRPKGSLAAPPRPMSLWKTCYQRKNNSTVRAHVEGWGDGVVRYRRTEHGELLRLRTTLFRELYEHLPGFVEPKVRFGTVDFEYAVPAAPKRRPVNVKPRKRARAKTKPMAALKTKTPSARSRVATIHSGTWPRQRVPHVAHRDESLHR